MSNDFGVGLRGTRVFYNARRLARTAAICRACFAREARVWLSINGIPFLTAGADQENLDFVNSMRLAVAPAGRSPRRMRIPE
jgi:hypothetical protein